MAQQFLATPGGNLYPDPDTSYDQSEAFRTVAHARDTKDRDLQSAIENKADKGDLEGPIPSLSNTNLDNFFTSGRWTASASNGVSGYPPQTTGALALLHVWYISATRIVQEWMTTRARYIRSHNGTAWGEWEEWSSEAFQEIAQIPPLLVDVDLDTVRESTRGVGGRTSGVTNYPPALSGATAFFQSVRIHNSTLQWWTTNAGNVWHRQYDTDGSWHPWSLDVTRTMSEIKIFETQAEAIRWETEHLGGIALFLGEG